MNKAELAAAVAAKTGMERKESEKVVAATFEAIREALAAGEKVQIVGFGAFSVKERAAHAGINPKTKEPITVAASKAAAFKPGKELKESVNK